MQSLTNAPPQAHHLTHSAKVAVAIDGLIKNYGTKRAVDGLSLEVYRGEIFALLGPNGAGKTTTVEVLEGYRKPDAGRVQVLGFDPVAQGAKLKPHIGVMLQEAGLYPAITAREALRLFADFYPNPRSPDELLGMVGLEDVAGIRYRRLSGGQKQRLALALALIGRPELVFLDEPTAGLDPQARHATWDIIADLRQSAVTVVLTTHYLEEAERLADRVAIIDDGRLLALGSPHELVESDASVVRLRTAAAVDRKLLASLPAAASVRPAGPNLYAIETTDVSTLLVELTSCLRDAGILATELRVGRGSLEEVFLELTGKELRA